MPAGGRPTVRSRRLGSALRQYRQAAKIDQPQAAELIASSQARISRVESGHATPRVIEVRLLLEAYGVSDEEVRLKLEELARQPKKRGWWSEHAPHLRPKYVDHIALEDDATTIRQWQQVLVPGLLQIPAYSETVVVGGPNRLSREHIERLLEVRKRRQERITKGGVMFRAVIWEAVIRHPLVDAQIHCDQLAALLEVGQRENVTLQVLPFSAGTLPAATPAFAAFSFDTDSRVEVVAMDDLTSAPVIDSSDDLDSYYRVFEQLQTSALTTEQSAELIQSTLKAL
ncbi:helix-turn-helix transcriptional regulator [Streptomyces sp. J2-1]|uniref:helix-turn-helix domain-containing protein n=1 Tax=Streptomyces corallincola TaxID=2851888 RepID=UPI001C395A1F|nr:helix-turn-helix transcriptional regulator [Streptomyces corallincola]MBV2357451.1 helix-turn-helix transcriptional regulator [Streptomyces corallincola]